MYFDRKCKITYISHGATIYSEDGRICDTEPFPPLSDNGIEEIERVCEILKNRRIRNDKIISSAGLRCVQSAKIISKLFKQNFVIDENLKPKNYGDFNGLTLSQIEAEHPEEFQTLIHNPDVAIPKNAQSISDFLNETFFAIDKIVEENTDSRLIIITYPEIIQAAVAKALKVPDSMVKNIYIKTGSLTQISYFDKFESLIYCGYKAV